MSETDYYKLKSRAEGMGLNWPRMYGVATEVHDDCWDSIMEVLEDCVEKAEGAVSEGKDVQSVVRTRLIQCMNVQIEELLDDGYYDCEDLPDELDE